MDGAPLGVRFESHGQTRSMAPQFNSGSKSSARLESHGSSIYVDQQQLLNSPGTSSAVGSFPDDRSGVVPARHINTMRAYSDATRRKTLKMPREGIMMRITNVLDIYRTVRVLVAMISNAWSWSFSSAANYRMVMPQLGRIRVGNKTFIVPGYLLPDLEPMCKGTEPSSLPSHKSFSSPTLTEYILKHPIEYYPQMIVLLKLRFLLRLHSAGCEMDYKMCSFKTLIMGLQYVILQQHAAVETDSVFQSNISQSHAGSHFSLESLVDDIFDQLQRALGSAWRPFLEFVFTCDPNRSVQSSKMENRTSPPKITSNKTLAVVLDTVFVANFLRQPRKNSENNLRRLYDDLELLHMPLPLLPPLHNAQHLRAWGKAQSRPTRADRERVAGKDYEKLAQLDAVLLTAAVELHLPEVIASPEDQSDKTVNGAVSGSLSGEIAPEPAAFGISDKPGSAGPKAARVILIDKPQVSPVLFDAAMHSIHHHVSFPDGIRERLYDVLSDEYGITQEQSQRLAIAVTQNIDGNRLNESVLLGMEHREKDRLRNYQAATNKDTSHLLVSPLVACPIDKGKAPKYTQSPPGSRCSTLRRTTGSLIMGSCSQDRSFSSPSFFGKQPFKVPLQPGPLTMDPESGSLRTTGFFFKMPAL